MQRLAEWLIRGQANQAGRSHCTAAAELRPPRPPRGLSLITCEYLPGGASLRARLWAAKVVKGSVNFFGRLSECQRDAATGMYAEALAGFVQWLAAGLPARRDRFRAEVERRRADLAGVGGHNRAPTPAADLLAALDLLLGFADEVGAVTTAEADALRERGRSALLATAAAQAEHQRDADPAGRFLTLFGSALSSGRAHLSALDGSCPGDATAAAVGWRRENGGNWTPQGRRVGWTNGERVFLDPDAALAEANRLAAEQGHPLDVPPRALWQRLHEAGHLAAVEKGSGGATRYKIRLTADGDRREVIALRADRLPVNISPGGGGDTPS